MKKFNAQSCEFVFVKYIDLTIGKSSLHNDPRRRDSEIEALNWHIGKPTKKKTWIEIYCIFFLFKKYNQYTELAFHKIFCTYNHLSHPMRYNILFVWKNYLQLLLPSCLSFLSFLKMFEILQWRTFVLYRTYSRPQHMPKRENWRLIKP